VTPPRYLAKGHLNRGATSVWFGPPKSGKAGPSLIAASISRGSNGLVAKPSARSSSILLMSARRKQKNAASGLATSSGSRKTFPSMWSALPRAYLAGRRGRDDRARREPSLAAASVLTGCASRSSDIAAAYVSPPQYQSLSCAQIKEEAARVSARAAVAPGAQDQNATNDTIATTAAVILFWPAAFLDHVVDVNELVVVGELALEQAVRSATTLAASEPASV
jgi:hypothetical protein